MVSIEITNQHGTYLVSSNEDLAALDDYFECLIIPALLAAGFSKKLIGSYLGIEMDEEEE
jgi:hypothetical protein